MTRRSTLELEVADDGTLSVTSITNHSEAAAEPAAPAVEEAPAETPAVEEAPATETPAVEATSEGEPVQTIAASAEGEAPAQQA